MWNLYDKLEAGIAIKTTFGQLSAAVSNIQDEIYVIKEAARVRYLDHFKDSLVKFNIKQASFMIPAMFKHLSYEPEKEIRALISTSSHKSKINIRGYKLKVDLIKLVNEVVINPNASPYHFRVVESLLDKYRIPLPLNKSCLAYSYYKEIYFD